MLKVRQGLVLKSPAQQLKRAPNHMRGKCTHLRLPALKGFPSPGRADPRSEELSCETAGTVQAHLQCSPTSACLVPVLGHRHCVSTTGSMGLGQDRAQPLCYHVYSRIPFDIQRIAQKTRWDSTTQSLVSQEDKLGTAYSRLSSTPREKAFSQRSSSHSENAS